MYKQEMHKYRKLDSVGICRQNDRQLEIGSTVVVCDLNVLCKFFTKIAFVCAKNR